MQGKSAYRNEGKSAYHTKEKLLDFCTRSRSLLEEACEKALRQAKENQYEEELRREGFSDITTYGVCFWKKEVMIRRLEPQCRTGI